LITWYFGLPTSSSHALIGGYAGAAIAAFRGFSGLLKPEGWIKTLIFIVARP
jgi:PiT family inorganic phosphate transporter